MLDNRFLELDIWYLVMKVGLLIMIGMLFSLVRQLPGGKELKRSRLRKK